MTNTNDFRRYSYVNDPTYLIDQFDVRRGSQAPKMRPDVQHKPEFKVRENKQFKTTAQIKAEQKLAFGKAIVVVVVAALCFAMLAGVLRTNAIKNEMTKKISYQQIDIANAESENISLQSELDSLVSMSMIDQYAVEKLGMTKVRSNQIQYIDVNDYKAKRQAQIKKTPADTAKQATSNNK